MGLRKAIAVLVLAFSSATGSLSRADTGGAVSTAETLFANGRPQEALDVLQAAAARNDHAAQAELGGIYFAGVFVPRDDALAEKFLRTALSDPQAEYQRDLACVLYHRGGAGNRQESAALIEQAAQQNDVLALVYESRLYRLGIERSANASLANYKLEKALGHIYERPGRDTAGSAYLRAHISEILASGICGPVDEYGSFLAKSFPMRYREWPSFGKRSSSNPLFLYLTDN